MSKHIEPDKRKSQLLKAALVLAEEGNYRTIKRRELAEAGEVSTGTVSLVFGDMDGLRTAVMRYAVKMKSLRVILQGIAARDKIALSAPASLRKRAAAP